MAFDGITTAALADELNRTLSGGRISKIAQPESDEIILTIKTPTGQQRLFLSADASLPLVYLTQTNKQGPMTAPGFCMLLRKHLSSGRILSIRQPGLERILMIDIEHLDEMGDLCQKTLIVELMGKHSNIIFCDQNGKIIDSIKHVSALVSSVREVLPGRDYFIPNTLEKKNPLEPLTLEEFQEIVFGKSTTTAKALYTGFTGFSPIAAQELCYLSGVDGDDSTAAVSEDAKMRLYAEFVKLCEKIAKGNFSPVIYYESPNVPKEFSATSITMFDDLLKETSESVSEVLEKYYAQKNLVSRIRQRSSDLRRIVQTALERNVKKYDLQAKQLKDTEKKEKYRIYGELINTYGYGLEDGCKSFEALNYYTGETIQIPLDPMYTPSENAKRYFDKYQKLKRTEEALSHLLTETGDEIQHLESILTSLNIALYEEDLTEIRQELSDSGYIRKKNGEKKRKITSKPFHYLSSDGYDIYVGKNNFQNDYLTFTLATGNDWWFHAKKIPGSHVVVKGKGVELPDRVYEEAASLAAYYSKGKDQEKVEVDYLQKKNVKKPGGAKPGFVVYYTNYSMAISPDISSLTLVQE